MFSTKVGGFIQAPRFLVPSYLSGIISLPPPHHGEEPCSLVFPSHRNWRSFFLMFLMQDQGLLGLIGFRVGMCSLVPFFTLLFSLAPGASHAPLDSDFYYVKYSTVVEYLGLHFRVSRLVDVPKYCP